MLVTGIQPTGSDGSIHIGNLLGAVIPLVALQRPAEGSVMFIADYHSITVSHDPVALRENSVKLAAVLIASGVDVNKTILFKQSDVPAHTELAWILMCTAARCGWLNRMIQFKEKAEALGEGSEGPSVGLYTYPVLQAADILCYQADCVPVGEDQMQHLNLTVDIAEKFNREFGQLFTIPKALVTTNVKRIMSLTDPTKKMSKSEPNADSRINLDDSPDDVVRKLKRATTDSQLISEEGIDERHGLKNLLSIYCAFTDVTFAEALEQFDGKGFGVLKPAVAEVVNESLRPLQLKYRSHMDDLDGIASILSSSAEQASMLANSTLQAVKQSIGV